MIFQDNIQPINLIMKGVIYFGSQFSYMTSGKSYKYDEEIAARYAEADREFTDSPGHQKTSTWLEKSVHPIIHANTRVLDLGVGTGRWFDSLSKAGTVVGIDASRPMLNFATDKPVYQSHSGLHVSQGDVSNLPIQSESIDVVISIGVFAEHVPANNRTFGEVARVLRPGGIFAFTIPKPTQRLLTWMQFVSTILDNPLGRKLIEYTPISERVNERLRTYQCWLGSAEERIRELLNEVGLNVNNCEIRELPKGKFQFFTAELA